MTTQIAMSRHSLITSLRTFAADIKLAHSIFALPFAASAFWIGEIPSPNIRQALLLLVCMVSARTVAMGMNRYLDRQIDLINPRTTARKIPSGELSPHAALWWSALAALIFVAAAWGLSPLAGYCAVPLLLILVLYSSMKRLSWLTHWYLGFCLGLAPVGVAVAMTGTVSLGVLLVGVAVCFWTAGFDIIYALQDRDFDRRNGLHSVPSRFSTATAITISRLCFIIVVAALTFTGISSRQGFLYFAGVAAIAMLLGYEQFLVRDARITGTSKNLNVAFFNMNAYVSVIYLVFVILDATQNR